ncbi:MAG: hypothetical protein JSW63_05525 [Ignavibacterium sp.]|nr:MAG: hypothetical protein JSW63_05525 [Ignavibacterium sp.]
MNVLKFGGTSIATAERFKAVAKLVSDDENKIVVLSAMSGTTIVAHCGSLISKVCI